MNLSVKMKIALMAVAPVVITALVITLFTYFQLNKLGDSEVNDLRITMTEEMQQELKQYMDLAFSSVKPIYDHSFASDKAAQTKALEVIKNLYYGHDGYIFVNDEQGVVLANRAKPQTIGQNTLGMQDKNGVFVFKDLFAAARKGGGYVNYMWYKASKGTEVPKMSYAIYLPKWGWTLGTGFYTDDIDDAIAAKKAAVDKVMEKTIVVILSVAIIILAIVVFVALFLSGIITKSVLAINKFLKEVSEGEGDLTKELPVLSNDEMGDMAKHFNKFIGKLNEIISIVKEGSHNLPSASTELASTTEELTVTHQ